VIIRRIGIVSGDLDCMGMIREARALPVRMGMNVMRVGVGVDPVLLALDGRILHRD
jgi:hypothetical protein